MPITFTERELKELRGYILTQAEAKRRKDLPVFMAAGCAVVSFEAEHGREKTLAICNEIEKRHRLGQVANEVMKGEAK